MSTSYTHHQPSSDSSTSSTPSSENEDVNINVDVMPQFQMIREMIQYTATHIVPEFMNQPPARPPMRRRYVERRREKGHKKLVNDYFVENPTYPLYIFRRRFRMKRHIFLRLVEAAESHDTYFQRRCDASSRIGLSALQKCTAAMRMLAYGTAADVVDEYLRLGHTSAQLALEHFCDVVIAKFGNQYLRRPTPQDLQRLLRIGERRGFPGMLGSIDCMHWEWKNCPTAWRGQYQGRSGKSTIVLEAVASHDLWIWHSFFGLPGSCNDLNILQRSPVFDDILEGRAPPVTFEVNGHQYDKGYYLTDGIYPKWSTFIQSIALPQTRKHMIFAQRQESARKDVERAFRVLQDRFAILRNPALALSQEGLGKIMQACIIMHNMTVEDERDRYANYDDASEFWQDQPERRARPRGERMRRDDIEQDSNFNYTRESSILNLGEYLARRHDIRDKQLHLALKADLIEHEFNLHGP